MATPFDPADRPESTDRINDFLRQVLATIRDEHRSDTELLSRFVQERDQDAFRALIGRHGRSVWAVCLAVLGNPHDAEDAFQAAFITLARCARSVDARSGLGPWLRSTARMAARTVRRSARRLDRLRERVVAEAVAERHRVDESHAWVLAAEELEKLPRRLREPLVLCHLEGRTLAQAAELLGCSVSEAHRRVDCALEKLRSKLSARGVALTAGVLAAIPAGLITSTASAAGALARGLPLPSARLAALTDAILAPRVPHWLVAVGAAVVLAAGAAAALIAYPAPPPDPLVASAPPAVAVEEAAPAPLVGRVTGPTAVLTGRVTGPTGAPVPGATVSALVRRPWAPGNRGLRDDVVARVTTGADGRYMITVPADFATHYPERSVTLLVSGPGLPTTAKLVRLGDGGADVGVPATRTVAGTCVGPDGEPVAGVKLGVVRIGSAADEPVDGGERRPPDGWPADVVSGANGAFRIADLPADEDVWVEVRDDRFARSAVRFWPGQREGVRLALAPPRVLRGRVTAADTGAPLAGARVSVFAGQWTGSGRLTAVTATANTASESPLIEFDTVSGADGSYRLRLPPEGPYRVFVIPPPESPYLALGQKDAWWRDALNFALPAGRLVRGVLRDDAGRPVASGWVMYQPGCGNAQLPRGVLLGRDAAVRTGADGAFALAVPSGRGALEGWGPTSDYRPASHDPTACPVCGKTGRRSFEHAHAELGTDPAAPLALTLHRGEGVRVDVVDPDDRPVRDGVAVCRAVVQPLRNLVTKPISIRDGACDLPGCAPGRIYPIALLDPERELGALAEVRVGERVRVKLDRCGAAEVRLTDLARRPLAGVPAVALLLLDCDRSAGAPARNAGEWTVDQSWFDPKHHLARPETDEDGRVTLRALVPGAEYAVYFQVGEKVYTSQPFRVSPGRIAQLPPVTALLGRLAAPMEEPFP